ncbi:DUF4260 domain-containing protein [Paracoccus sediminicola]|uniref:DUF4260 domain-containing protein n=1 Tax=Paracoccus sediminicola TaxID=3017783 RepID=UPI0022F0C05E|nr:DUF4260 domain-containing protein [Paracoccus sediminicola]WBU55552.1 DUF4260 domain-containing protein [Paracoccus sediminicola]
MNRVVIWQRVEGAVVFFAGIWIYSALGGGFAWWLALLLFFAPDLAFAGYAGGPKIGAAVYNLVHLYAFGLMLLMLGSVIGNGGMMALAALWLGHAGFDRMLGYGLKTDAGFGHTHLGPIGRNR